MNQERALENLPLDFFHLCLFLCEKEVSPNMAPAVWIIPKMSHRHIMGGLPPMKLTIQRSK